MKNNSNLIKGRSDEIRQSLIDAVRCESDKNIKYYLHNDLLWLRYVRQIESVLQITSHGGKLLDIGCGVGITTAIISSLNPELDVIGIDIVETEIWRILYKYGARYAMYEAQNLPYKNSSFDYCTAFGVMEHTTDDTEFLIEVNRILKPGGHLFIFNLPSKYALFERLGNLGGVKSHDVTYTLPKMRDLMKSTRFNIIAAKREFLLPAQLERINENSFRLYNKYYKTIDKIDLCLAKLFNWFSQSYVIHARKY